MVENKRVIEEAEAWAGRQFLGYPMEFDSPEWSHEAARGWAEEGFIAGFSAGEISGMEQASFVLDALACFTGNDNPDLGDASLHKEEDGRLTIEVGCSDVFWWGTADGEELTTQNIGVFRTAVADLNAVKSGYGCFANDLFCARVRGMRPQGAMYKCYPEETHALFNAAGPPRAVDLMNPREIGE